MLDRFLERLFARNHKVCFRVLCLCLSASFLWPSCYSSAPAFANCYQVLIFSQWTKVLDIMDYYFSEKGFEVSRIDGSVKLDDRKRQVCINAWITQLLIIHLNLLLIHFDTFCPFGVMHFLLMRYVDVIISIIQMVFKHFLSYCKWQIHSHY